MKLDIATTDSDVAIGLTIKSTVNSTVDLRASKRAKGKMG